jgi:hypothetical protein
MFTSSTPLQETSTCKTSGQTSCWKTVLAEEIIIYKKNDVFQWTLYRLGILQNDLIFFLSTILRSFPHIKVSTLRQLILKESGILGSYFTVCLVDMYA